MYTIIKILPEHVVNKIAAGEAVERPASVVKELIENSIDAGATKISIDIEQAGRRLIRIIDDGCGMSKEDARTAFLRHATSKITSDKDLDAVTTMGFRGEALSSIAAISQVRMLSAMRNAPAGTLVTIEAGQVKSVEDAAAPQGTSIEVAHMFYNTPARLKFLKSAGTEFSHIIATVSRQAMANPAIQFKLTHNKKNVLDLPSSTSLKERVFQLYGSEIAENVIAFSAGRDSIHVHGLVGNPAYSRADRTYQDFYVNRRAVKNQSLTHALYAAYGDMLMRDRHPIGFVFLEIEPALVDVNVHPTKAEVRFRNQAQVHDLVRDAVRDGLRAYGTPIVQLKSTDGLPVSGVQTALSDYFRRQETSCSITDRTRSTLFGRRKSDWNIMVPQNKQSDAPVNDFVAAPLQQALMQHEYNLFPLAQIHQSFIVAQSNDGMAIIDQHAAHERVLFEKLQNQYGMGHMPVQDLLVAEQVELGPAQSCLLSEVLPDLHHLGLIVEDFGNGTFMIKTIPALLVGADYKQLLLDILDEVNVHGKSGKMEALRDEILSVMACHPAVKVHRRLDQREMDVLIRDLLTCRMPYTCPHGRPTIIWFSIDELKKMFKRL